MVFVVDDEHYSPRDLREAKLCGLRAEHEARANWGRPDGQDDCRKAPTPIEPAPRTTPFQKKGSPGRLSRKKQGGVPNRDIFGTFIRSEDL